MDYLAKLKSAFIPKRERVTFNIRLFDQILFGNKKKIWLEVRAELNEE